MQFAALFTPTLKRPPTDTDRLMLAIVVGNMALALSLGYQFNQFMQAVLVSSVCGATALAVTFFWRGSTLSTLVLSAALCALVTAQIVIGRAVPAMFLNISLSCVLLLTYRDWRPLALATAWFVTLPLWLSPSAPGSMAWAMGFVTVQGLLLCRMAAGLNRVTREAMELEFLVNAMGRDGPIRLNLDVVRLETAAGKRLKHVQQRMADAMRQVREASESVQRAAEHVAHSSTELRGRTDRTASGLNESAMCLDQIGIIVRHSSDASSEAKNMSSTAATMANDGGQLVAQVITTMHDIEASSRKIHSIVGVIDSIAFQTNILALNAAVEAARAGEQGRGFAVVAAEVRSLAQRSASAAREIKDLIANSSATVERGTHLVSGAGQTMTELVSSVKRVGELFEHINADADDHAQGLREVTSSMQELNAMTRENVSVAEESSAIAHELKEQAQRLGEVLAAFRLSGDSARQPPQAPPTSSATTSALSSRSTPKPRATAAASVASPPAASTVDFF